MAYGKGAADWYRDMTHHGGILSTLGELVRLQVKTVQYGLGERDGSRVTGDLVCRGRDALRPRAAENRCDFGDEISPTRSDDAYHKRARRCGRR